MILKELTEKQFNILLDLTLLQIDLAGERKLMEKLYDEECSEYALDELDIAHRRMNKIRDAYIKLKDEYYKERDKDALDS